MAETTKTTPKKKNLKPFPMPPQPVSTEPQTPFEAQPPAEPPKKKKIGRPLKGTPPKHLTFFEKLQQIDPADWSDQRAKVQVYRLAPIIDQLAGGSEFKFITFYHEPLTEQRLKIDQGSGKYRLYLKYTQPGGREQEVDKVDIAILDMNYPPRIPPGTWMDHPKNAEWAWAKPPGAGLPGYGYQQPQQQPQPVNPLLEGIKLGNEIRRDAREELKTAEPQQHQATAAPTAPDPFDTAAKIMAMRSNDPMVTILSQQLKDMAIAAEAGRQREFELQKELRQQANDRAAQQPAPAPPKSLMDQLTEISDGYSKLKGLFGGGSSEAKEPQILTTKIGGGLAVVREILPQIIDSDLGKGLGQWLASLAFRNQQPAANGQPAAQPHPNGTVQPQPQQPETGENVLVQFMATNLLGPLDEYFFAPESTGDQLAAWLYNGYPSQLQAIQKFSHSRMPGLVGAPALHGLLKNTTLWPKLAPHETRLSQFLTAFCAWKPDDDIADAETEEVPQADYDFEKGEEAQS